MDIPPRLEATFYTALGEESLVIDKIRSVELEQEFLVATTTRNERFVVLYEDVRAVRFGNGGTAAAGYDR